MTKTVYCANVNIMTSSVSNQPNHELPPPTSQDVPYLFLAPPEGYTQPTREELWGQAESVGASALAGSIELVTDEPLITPSYSDRYKVYDKKGDLVLGEDGLPLDTRTAALEVVSSSIRKATAPYLTIDGKPLGLVLGEGKDSGNILSRAKRKLATKIYNRYEDKYDLQAFESAKNAEQQKIIQDTVGTGPDENERLLFVTQFVEGRLQRYDGTPLNPLEIVKYQRQAAAARVNKSRYQGLAAYEIGKREEQEQGGGLGMWLQIANKMHSELGYSQDDIMGVYVGLQYMKKGQYLSIKHTPLNLVDKDGVGLKESDSDYSTRLVGSKYVFGDLKERSYVTELADKFAGHQMTFSAADVVDTLRLARLVSDRLGDGTKTTKQMNKRGYQNDAFIMHKLWSTVENSRMGNNFTEVGKDGLSPEDMARMQERALAGVGSGYPPRISGSAEANQAWKILATVVDAAAIKNPVVKMFNEEEYAANGKQLTKK